MMKKCDYLREISKRGDTYGSCGGVLSLLCWCDKPNTQMVTMEEARRFYEHPEQPYRERNTGRTQTG